MTYEPTADGGKVHADAWSTEQAAADLQTSERKRETWARVVECLRVGRQHPFHRPEGEVPPGLTDDELRRDLRWVTGHDQSKSGPATRRGELVDLGYVRPQRDEHGEIVKRPSDLGGPMIVWELVPADEYVRPEPRSSERQPTTAGLAAVIRLLDWETGDHSLAQSIVRAYLNPEVAQRELDDEGAAR